MKPICCFVQTITPRRWLSTRLRARFCRPSGSGNNEPRHAASAWPRPMRIPLGEENGLRRRQKKRQLKRLSVNSAKTTTGSTTAPMRRSATMTTLQPLLSTMRRWPFSRMNATPNSALRRQRSVWLGPRMRRRLNAAVQNLRDPIRRPMQWHGRKLMLPPKLRSTRSAPPVKRPKPLPVQKRSKWKWPTTKRLRPPMKPTIVSNGHKHSGCTMTLWP